MALVLESPFSSVPSTTFLLCDYEDSWIPPATGSSLPVLKPVRPGLDPGSSTGSHGTLGFPTGGSGSTTLRLNFVQDHGVSSSPASQVT